jgi:hypothetical protein
MCIKILYTGPLLGDVDKLQWLCMYVSWKFCIPVDRKEPNVSSASGFCFRRLCAARFVEIR